MRSFGRSGDTGRGVPESAGTEGGGQAAGPGPARRRLRSALLASLLILLGVWIMRGALLRQMLYPAPAFPVPEAPAGFQEVLLGLPGGDRVHGWFRPEPGAAFAFVLLHGNGENLGTLAYSGLFERFSELGTSFLALDYPGYGRNTGSPTETANVDAALAGLRWLEDHHPEARRILFGWSLGAAVALQAADREPSLPDALALFSPWSSLEAVAREHFPGWLVHLGLVERYDSVAAAERVGLPALVVHGREDTIIPAAQGAAVAARLAGPKRWVEVPDAGHNDLLGKHRAWKELSDFLGRI